jgi:hypothetical protein
MYGINNVKITYRKFPNSLRVGKYNHKKHKSVLGNFLFYGKRLFPFDKTRNIIE